MRARAFRILLAVIAWGGIAVIFVKLNGYHTPYAPLWMLLGTLMGIGATALTLAAIDAWRT